MILGCQVIETLYESTRSLIRRGRRASDQVSIVLKQLQPEYPSPDEIARFRLEYELTERLHGAGAIEVYALETDGNHFVMIEEDGGESLDHYVSTRDLSLKEFLTLAIQITSALDKIHQQRVLHRNINPSNIVRHPLTGQIKIIDFGIATVLPQGDTVPYDSQNLWGTPAYMAPEQTGRMNQSIDYRTDLYALGITFYRLLCHHLPFESDDILELVHCHIAKQPAPINQHNPQIPQVVSDIVMKLIAKHPADRYQSAWGLKTDLQACLDQLETSSTISSFALAQYDTSEQFQISSRLYSRKQATKTLMATCKRISSPSPKAELLLITGSAGVGKSALVKAAYQQLSPYPGYLLSGKSVSLQQNTPYFPFIQALQGLVQQLLTESDSRIAVWREQILAALGTNGQVIVEVIPELELIIGSQPAVPKLSAAESQNRFNFVFQQFIEVFTQSEHPLILFLDDLHWADQASLSLIQLMLTTLKNQALLLIGAYREHEVDTTHPLKLMLNELQKQAVPVSLLTLTPLNLTAINQLIADTLNCQPEVVKPLAEFIARKTQGNPLFATELLKFLYQQGDIFFNAEQRLWQWNLEQIQVSCLADTVVELVLARLHQLPEPTKRLLQLAACVGHQVDSKLLSTISQEPDSKVVAHLQKAVQAGLLLQVKVDQEEGSPTSKGNQKSNGQASAPVHIYQFAHDRVQDAIYTLTSESNRNQVHLNIGRVLLQLTPSELIENKIFEIVNQLNFGVDLIADQTDKDQLAQLNLIAANRAKSAVAYKSALNYLDTARRILSEQAWNRNYDLYLALYSLLVEVSYVNGDFQQMEQWTEVVFQQARTLLDKLKVYEIQIQAYIAQDKLSEAIDTALYTLRLLGIDISRQPQLRDITLEATRTKAALANKQIEDLVNLPRMEDEYKLAAMRVIASICTPTYFTMPQLWQLMVFQKVQLSVQFGNAPGSAFGYSDYGMVLCAVEKDIDAGYQFAQLASTLLPQLDAKEFVPKTLLLINCYLRYWKEHLRNTLAPLREAYQCGLETGDLEFATFAIAFHSYHSYLIGQELAQLEQEMAAYGKTIAQLKQTIPLQLNQIYRQAILILMETSEQPNDLIRESYSQQNQLDQQHTANNRYILFHVHFNQLILYYLFANNTEAVKHATEAEQLLSEQATGMLVTPAFYFYSSLAKLAILDQVSSTEQAQLLAQVECYKSTMKDWANHAPMNFLHKYCLIQAEHYRTLKQDAQAIDEYDRAIEFAKQYEYINEEALAHELAAKFYLAKGKLKIARVYMLDARYCYLKWGALAKVRDLETCYPQLFASASTRETVLPIAIKNSESATASTLNLTTVMKAAQILSSEMVLDRLLVKLMEVLIENAGAERGYLILETEEKLIVEAEKTADSNQGQVLQSIPIDDQNIAHLLSTGIIHYVARTQENVVISNALQDKRFMHCSYITQQQPKSILCAPLVNQSKLIGVIYLENNLMTGAFADHHLEVVQLLSAQAAISIENARLYNEMEVRIQQRTAELVQSNHQLECEVQERQLSEQTLRLIVEGTAAVTGKDFFHSLVRSLAKALGVYYAFITECDISSPTRLRSIACWYRNQSAESFEYDIQGTACEQVINSKGCQCYPKQLQSLFPEDVSLLKMEAQSYAGVALLDSAGHLLGHLAVLDDRPMEDTPRKMAILEIFAARAAAEMERQQAEEALRISQEKFSKAFRSSPSGITITTLEDGRYIEANDSFLRMMGYTPEEMLGESSLELGIWAKPDDRAAMRQILQAQSTISNFEVELCKKSGETFTGLVSAEIVDLREERCLIAVVTDITMLKQATKALERLAEIGELSSMIVHEVRNPLTTMLMGLNAFKRLELPERFQEYLSLALGEGDRLQRLLNQILLYAKPQTLNRSELNLNCFITETLDLLQAAPAAMTKQLQFTSTLTATVSADRDKLKQVLINLVTNACEAAKDGAVITVSLQKGSSNHAQIQVHNSGDPIPAEILAKLTKPFFTTKSNGNGLGLAIVKRIVEAHNGILRIESLVDVGTTVTVQLPMEL